MSKNLDLVRSIYAAWERGDFSQIEWVDPEIEFVVTGGLASGSWRGVAKMAEYVREVFSEMEDWRDEADEYRELADGRVLVLDRLSARGRTSGADLGQTQRRGARVFHIHGGRFTRLVVYWDRERALADLGLAPEAG